MPSMPPSNECIYLPSKYLFGTGRSEGLTCVCIDRYNGIQVQNAQPAGAAGNYFYTFLAAWLESAAARVRYSLALG